MSIYLYQDHAAAAKFVKYIISVILQIKKIYFYKLIYKMCYMSCSGPIN